MKRVVPSEDDATKSVKLVINIVQISESGFNKIDLGAIFCPEVCNVKAFIRTNA